MMGFETAKKVGTWVRSCWAEIEAARAGGWGAGGWRTWQGPRRRWFALQASEPGRRWRCGSVIVKGGRWRRCYENCPSGSIRLWDPRNDAGESMYRDKLAGG